MLPAPRWLPDSADAVVVGAGLGGLGAAVEMARHGARVLALEQHNLPGGFATSFVRGRFEFEPSLHQLPGTPPLPGLKGVRDYLRNEAEVDLELVPVPEAYRLILTDSTLDVTVPFGIDAFIETVEAHAPGSRKAVTTYLDLCRDVLDALMQLDGRQGGGKGRLVRRHRSFFNTAGYSVAQVARALGLTDRALEIIYPYWCYLGVPMSRLSFTIWAAMLYTYLSAGAGVPRLRSHQMAVALQRRVESLGGAVELGQQVAEILVEDGQVQGVRTTGGETVRTRHVISNASPTLTFDRLVKPQRQVPRAARRHVNARRAGVSTFVVYMGLDASAEELGIDGYSTFIAPHMDTDRIYAATGTLDAPLMQASVCLNNAVPECSPPGTCILSLTTCFRPAAWHGVEAGRYFDVKRRVAEAMIRQFEDAVGTDLRGHIEELEIAAPQTFARYTGAHDGVVYGYEPDPWDSIVPRALSIAKETYLGGLQFCGGYSYRCHGYGSSLLSGVAAARRTLAAMEARR